MLITQPPAATAGFVYDRDSCCSAHGLTFEELYQYMGGDNRRDLRSGDWVDLQIRSLLDSEGKEYKFQVPFIPHRPLNPLWCWLGQE